jgi:Uma2 family endonuclease
VAIAEKTALLTVEEYLAGERHSEVRHEYVAGAVDAMAGACLEHNTISLNIAAELRQRLRGTTCRVFMADAKVRPSAASEQVFYYPDVMVACDPRDTDRYFLRFPKLLIEVLSEETERTDRREKFLAYTQIETLEEYVLVAQNRAEATLFRRRNNWTPEVFNGRHGQLQLDSINCSMPLDAVYEGVNVS